MAEFRLADRRIHFNIAGRKYSVAFDNDIRNAVLNAETEIRALAEDVTEGRMPINEAEFLVLKKAEALICAVLHDKRAWARIFLGRKPTLSDAANLIWYMVGETNAARERIQKDSVRYIPKDAQIKRIE